MTTGQLIVVDHAVALLSAAAWFAAGAAVAARRARLALGLLGAAVLVTLVRVATVAVLAGRGWWFVQEKVLLGKDAKTVVRYRVKLELGGLTGLIAPILGKQPPDLHYWLVTGDVPAFVRFEGPMFLHGPVWRLELTTVQWPK